MSKSTHSLKLPNSVKNAAAELAKIDGVSLNQFIVAAVAEKVGALCSRRILAAARWVRRADKLARER
jgi:hypothetical protein